MEISVDKVIRSIKEGFGKVSPRTKRLLFYLIVFLAVLGYYHYKTSWNYERELKTPHYLLKSNNSAETTELTADILERQFIAYSRIFEKKRDTSTFEIHLYKDRKEFKQVNPLSGWAEAFYLYPVCHFYVNEKKANPYHWGLHEAVHQLNREYADLKLPLWCNEGIAMLFSTGIIDEDKNLSSKTDLNTYPIWWVDSFDLADDIEKDIDNRQFIGIKDIVFNKKPIDMDNYFNLYYVMWWALSHYLYWGDNGEYRDDYMKFINGKISLEDFYKNVIEANDIEKKIHNKLKQKTWNWEKSINP